MIHIKEIEYQKKIRELDNCCKALEKARIMGDKDGVIAMQDKIIEFQNAMIDQQQILIKNVFGTIKAYEDMLRDLLSQYQKKIG